MGKKVENSGSKITSNYGTKSENVIKISDINLSVFDKNLANDKIVIAKDIDNSFYVTIKSYVDSGLLDPFKCYRKNQFTIKSIENEDKSLNFSIKYQEINPGITI